MPLYEYRCKSCSRDFELLRPMEFSDKNADCPSCASPSMRKLSVFASSTRSGANGESAPTSVPASGGDGCCGGGACGAMN